jgi:uncharacterized metal-binding protein
MKIPSCSCGSDEKINLIYSCSGAANTGLLADQTARRLSKEGVGNMSCLSGIGANLSNFIEGAKVTKNILIDGCPLACGKKMFDKLALPYQHLIITNFGVEKGKTVITEDVIEQVKGSLKEAILNEKQS